MGSKPGPTCARIEAVRLKAGPLMGLGDVTAAPVPKLTLVSAPLHGGAISTRSFIPHRGHAFVGVLAAVSVATACLMPQSPAAGLAHLPPDDRFRVAHPTGAVGGGLEVADGGVTGAGSIRTARKLFDGRVFPLG